MRVLLALAALLAASAAAPLAQTRIDPVKLCNAGMAIGLEDDELRYTEWFTHPGEFFCAAGKQRQEGVGAPYLRFQVDGTEEDAMAITVDLTIDDPKLTASTVAQTLQPLLRAMFEAAGTRMPDELVKAVNTLRAGRFATPLGRAIATYKANAKANTAQYSLEFTLPEPAPAAPTRR